MVTATLTVINEVGLHARPAALFVQEASKFKSKIRVRNQTTSTGWVDAKSILSILTLTVNKNDQIELTAQGIDEAEALMALRLLVETNFASKS